VIVLSGDPAFAPEGVEVASSSEAAIARAQAVGRDRAAREILVAGGGMLYAALIGVADRLHITEVDAAPVGDVRFPAIDPARWRETARQSGARTARDAAAFTFLTYERTA
jgi:dihydrofolate reductase